MCSKYIISSISLTHNDIIPSISESFERAKLDISFLENIKLFLENAIINPSEENNCITLLAALVSEIYKYFIQSDIISEDYIKKITDIAKDILKDVNEMESSLNENMSEISVYKLRYDVLDMKDMVTLLQTSIGEIIRYFISDQYRTDATIRNITDISKHSNIIESSFESVVKIVMISLFHTTSLKASYMNDEMINTINDSMLNKSENALSDEYIDVMSKYILSLSNNIISEIITKTVDRYTHSNVKYHSDARIEQMSTASILTLYNNVNTTTKLINEIFVHFIQLDHVFGTDISSKSLSRCGSSKFMTNTSDIHVMMTKMQNGSYGVFEDKLILLHETVIDE